MKKLNKQLTVYLSKSLLIRESKIRMVREKLTILGFKVNEYKEGTNYNSNLLSDADFVVFLTNRSPAVQNSGKFESFVGRGQFVEAEICHSLSKPSFVIHGLKSDDFLVSKLMGDSYTANQYPYRKYDINDWKNRYGTIHSYTMGMSAVPLFPMLEGMFGLKEIPFSSEEVFATMKNNRLLLLLK